MARKHDILILLAILLISYAAVGFAVGCRIYAVELAAGNSPDEAGESALWGGMLLSALGVVPGVLLMILYKAVAAEIRERKEINRKDDARAEI